MTNTFTLKIGGKLITIEGEITNIEVSDAQEVLEEVVAEPDNTLQEQWRELQEMMAEWTRRHPLPGTTGIPYPYTVPGVGTYPFRWQEPYTITVGDIPPGGLFPTRFIS